MTGRSRGHSADQIPRWLNPYEGGERYGWLSGVAPTCHLHGDRTGVTGAKLAWKVDSYHQTSAVQDLFPSFPGSFDYNDSNV